MLEFQAEILTDRRFTLAEGPVWDEKKQLLHFVDIKNCMLYTLDPSTGELTGFDANQNIGCFALREKGGFVLGLASGIYLLEADGELKRCPGTQFDPMTRANDGKCDQYGNFWCGSADLKEGDRKGQLFRLSPDGTCTEMLNGLGISNGLTFTENGLYFIDTVKHRVDAYTYSADRSALIFDRTVTDMEGKGYFPDGMTADADGMLWVAHWNGGFVGRYDPATGELLAKVSVPASQTSSCCFGGADMQTLFITTASEGKPDEPGAGKVYFVHLPWKGTPMFRYKG